VIEVATKDACVARVPCWITTTSASHANIEYWGRAQKIKRAGSRSLESRGRSSGGVKPKLSPVIPVPSAATAGR
jgi:hypothetical protein